jgi:hypothetical protein
VGNGCAVSTVMRSMERQRPCDNVRCPTRVSYDTIPYTNKNVLSLRDIVRFRDLRRDCDVRISAPGHHALYAHFCKKILSMRQLDELTAHQNVKALTQQVRARLRSRVERAKECPYSWPCPRAAALVGAEGQGLGSL